MHGPDARDNRAGGPDRRARIGDCTRFTDVGGGYARHAGALPRHRPAAARRYEQHGATDPLRGGPARHVEPPRDSTRRRRHERHGAASGGRGSPARLRLVRQRLGPRQRSEVGAQRRSDPQLGLRANEKDARHRVRADRAGLRRAPCLQLLRRRIAGRARRAHRRAALSRRLRRRVGDGADRGFFHTDARAHAVARSGATAERLGAADERPRAARGVHAPMRRPRRAHRRRDQQLRRLPRVVQRQRRRPRARPVGAAALPERRRPQPAGRVRKRVPHGTTDRDGELRVFAVRGRRKAGERAHDVSGCGRRRRPWRAAPSVPRQLQDRAERPRHRAQFRRLAVHPPA